MPVLRRRFQKVDDDDDDDDVAKGPVALNAKTPATTIGSKKSSRDPTFGLLLETPSANYQGDTFADWDAFAENSTLVKTIEVHAEQSMEMPTIPRQLEDLTISTSQDSNKKESSKVKIPPLKANRLDDIRHHRGKELLSAVSKDMKESCVASRSENLDGDLNQEIENSQHLPQDLTHENQILEVSHDNTGWIPFESGFEASLPQIDSKGEQISSPWDCFAEVPMETKESIPHILHESLPMQAQREATSIDYECGDHEISSRCSEATMPATLNIENVLDQVDNKSWEQASQSDIISVDNGEAIARTDVFITLNSGAELNSNIGALELPLVATEDDSEVFSLGLETMHETGNIHINKNQWNRESHGIERQGLLTPAPKLPVTPMGDASECSSPDSFAETSRSNLRGFSNDDEKTKRYGRKLSIDTIVETEEIGQDNDRSVADDANTCQAYHGKEKRQDDRFPSNIGVPSDNTRRQLLSAKQRIQKKRSIHFPTLSPHTHDTLLLDAQSEVSDPVSAIGSKSAMSDSFSQHEDKVNIIIDTGSFLSGDVSTISSLRNAKESHDLCDDSSDHTGKSVQSYEGRDRDAHLESDVAKKTKAKPLGASAHEIVMLNTFLRVAGPKLRSSNLSMEEREEIHRKALEGGLPEDFVHKMLDQTAGIVRWDDHSVRTPATASCTEASARSKHSICSSDSNATRYKRDDESISYYSFREMKSSSTEFDEGAYGCFQGFKSSFWVESGLSGNDMMENVSAAFSESFDEISKHRQRRRKRRTFVSPF